MSHAKSFRMPSLAEMLALTLPVLAAAGIIYYLVSTLPHGEDSNIARARDDIRALNSALLTSPVLPDTASGLKSLVVQGTIPFVPDDPWGHPYQYRNPGKEYAYELYSLGPDGVESKDDVIAWNLYGGR